MNTKKYINELKLAVLVGIGATFSMDFFNKIGFHLGYINPISLDFIGGLMYAWFNGEFFFEKPMDVVAFGGTRKLGLFSHYLIGIAFAFLYYLIARMFKFTKPEIYISSLIFGVSTSIVSLLFIFPSVGIGYYGRDMGFPPLVSSIYNHIAFGVGMSASFWLYYKFEKNSLPDNAN